MLNRVKMWWHWDFLCLWLAHHLPATTVFGVLLRVYPKGGPEPDFGKILNEWGDRAELEVNRRKRGTKP